MKKYIPILLFLFLCTNVRGQNNDISKDDDKYLKLDLLTKLVKTDLLTLDEALTKKDYSLAESDYDAGFISYKYVRYNFFFLKRFVTEKRLTFKTGYTKSIYEKYSEEITELKLQLIESILITNGIKTTYNDPQSKCVITFRKVFNPSNTQTIIEISISTP